MLLVDLLQNGKIDLKIVFFIIVSYINFCGHKAMANRSVTITKINFSCQHFLKFMVLHFAPNWHSGLYNNLLNITIPIKGHCSNALSLPLVSNAHSLSYCAYQVWLPKSAWLWLDQIIFFKPSVKLDFNAANPTFNKRFINIYRRLLVFVLMK